MAIAEDPTTPAAARSALATSTASLTTAQFSPPAGSLLVVLATVGQVNGVFTGSPTITITTTASGVTFTRRAFLASSSAMDYVGIWTAPLASAPGPMTVTATRSNTVGSDMQLVVRVVTGANLAQAGASVNVDVANTANTSITPTTVGSLLYVASGEPNGPTWTPVSGTSSIDLWSESASGLTVATGKATSLTSSLSPVKIGWTGPFSGDTQPVVVYEVTPATGSTASGTATGSLTLAGTSAARVVGALAGAISLTGTATGTAPGGGTASGQLTLAGALTVTARATATGRLSLVGGIVTPPPLSPGYAALLPALANAGLTSSGVSYAATATVAAYATVTSPGVSYATLQTHH